MLAINQVALTSSRKALIRRTECLQELKGSHAVSLRKDWAQELESHQETRQFLKTGCGLQKMPRTIPAQGPRSVNTSQVNGWELCHRRWCFLGALTGPRLSWVKSPFPGEGLTLGLGQGPIPAPFSRGQRRAGPHCNYTAARSPPRGHADGGDCLCVSWTDIYRCNYNGVKEAVRIKGKNDELRVQFDVRSLD